MLECVNMSDTLLHKLLEENKKLQTELTIAKQWIGREVSSSHLRRTKEAMKVEIRDGLQESREEIQTRISKYLGEYSTFLSEENRDLLVESELNFHHLVRKKDLDGFIVTNLYQKILEHIFEEHMTSHFRETHKRSRLHPRKNDLMEKTLYRVIHDRFQLSIGKMYQLFERMIAGDTGDLVNLFRETVESLPLYASLNDGEFWELFTNLMETKAFGEKRHAGKISLQDVIFLRESMTGNYEQEGLLKIMLKYLQIPSIS